MDLMEVRSVQRESGKLERDFALALTWLRLEQVPAARNEDLGFMRQQV